MLLSSGKTCFVGYIMTLSISIVHYVASHSMTNQEYKPGNYFEGSGRGLIDILQQQFPRAGGKPREPSARISDVATEIRTEYHKNTCLQNYH